MQNNICPECKTENEPDYQYCKNCGNPLFTAKPVQEAPAESAKSDDLTDDFSIFVGKNAPKIIPQFKKLQYTGAKISWCWAPFIFGFFFGPVGVAVWFLYRKMYSAASVFAAVGVAANYIMFALERFFNIGNSTNETLKNYFENYLSGNMTIESFISVLTNKQVIISVLANSVYNSVGVACAVIAGIFGIYLYKKHAEKTIGCLKSTVNDPNFVKFAIASKGGTSVGAVIVGLLIITLVTNIPEAISRILFILKV